MVKILIQYAEFLIQMLIAPRKICSVYILYHQDTLEEFLPILVERLHAYGYCQIILLQPRSVCKIGNCPTPLSDVEILAHVQALKGDISALILNLTWPNFNPPAWTKSTQMFLKCLQQKLPTCSVPVAHLDWAQLLFKNLEPSEAILKLWEVIFTFFPVKNIHDYYVHITNTQKYADQLSQLHFTHLRLTNGDGTDLTVKLHPNHRWITSCRDGICTNLPVNEVYTLPLKDGINGVYRCRGPVEINGFIVRDITLYFKAGKAAIESACGNHDQLKHLLFTDSGASYAGEIALVKGCSMCASSVLNSMMDENLFCHFALGNAYIDCLTNGESKSRKDLIRDKVNLSSIHADFWISNNELNVVGIFSDRQSIPLIENGKPITLT